MKNYLKNAGQDKLCRVYGALTCQPSSSVYMENFQLSQARSRQSIARSRQGGLSLLSYKRKQILTKNLTETLKLTKNLTKRASPTKRAGPPPYKHLLRGCLYEASQPSNRDSPVSEISLDSYLPLGYFFSFIWTSGLARQAGSRFNLARSRQAG